MSPNRSLDTAGEFAPPGVNPHIPHSARMYDWWLGGKDNFSADRAMGTSLMTAIPSLPAMAAENRKFLHRVVSYLASQAGIRQFLDIGTGIPTSPNLHEVAQAIAPETRVVYVDNDPIVLAHARALMTSHPAGATHYLSADLRQPERILSDSAVLDTLDLSRPVALMMVAILMLVADEEDPWGSVSMLMDALPSGSYVAITHPGHEFDPVAMAGITDIARKGGVTIVPRIREDVQRFFADWEIIEPGVVPVMAWRPDEEPADPRGAYYWAGVARKP